MEVEWKEGIKYKIIYHHYFTIKRWKRKKDKRRSKCREREREEGKMDMQIQR